MALWGGKQKGFMDCQKILKYIFHNLNIYSCVFKVQIVTLDPEFIILAP